MKKSQKLLWIIDVLTIIFVFIALQSIAECFEDLSDSAYLSLREVTVKSIQYCGVSGWSEILHEHLGSVVPWSKFLLFCANVYAVIWKAIGIAKKNIPSELAALIIVNLIFIVLKLIEFDNFWAGLMSV